MVFRLFKTRRFAAEASKAWIGDEALSEAFSHLLKGQADNLGGGVWKQRLKHNRHRSIVLAKGGRYWVYQFLFSKQNQSSLFPNELAAFRALAKVYEGLSEIQVQQLLDLKEFVEINHEQKV